MKRFFQEKSPVILITGANGWVGRNAAQALKDYRLILVDNKKGNDPFNRFGLEGAESSSTLKDEQTIEVIDLATQREAFSQLLQQTKPACVLHFAGVLENQEVDTIKLNEAINQNVLEVCTELGIKIIAASSIMVMYGSAIANEKIRAILEKQAVQINPNEQLTIESPLNNTPETLQQFNMEAWQKNLAYIKTKEALETLAKNLMEKNPCLTIVTVRLGWTGIKNPYELEGKVKYSETSVYLDQHDLQCFLRQLLQAVIEDKVTGYHCYISVSEHPQRWVNLENCAKDFGWAPKVNIVDKYNYLIKPYLT